MPEPDLPVARVYVDTGLAHLDRLFDYAVPTELAQTAQPGVRVKVRFAGKERSGFVLERTVATDSGRALTPLRTVVSAERVLTPQIAQLCEAVAARYGGTRGDVLRTAVPPRHARVEAEPRRVVEASRPVPELDDSLWSELDGGGAFIRAVATGHAAGTASVVLPPDAGLCSGWPAMVAELAVAALQRPRGSLFIVPDGRDLRRLDLAVTERLGPGRHVALAADLGPAERYRRFLSALRGDVQVVIGTRAAALAPVRSLGLVLCLDDGDDSLSEPRAPGWHVRDVLLRRAADEGATAVLAGYTVSCERALLVAAGWARSLRAPRAVIRARSPRVLIAGADEQLARDPMAARSRVPRQAIQLLRDGLAQGSPVLVQVPRRGYAPVLACVECGERASCPHCSGPLAQRTSTRRRSSPPGTHQGATSPAQPLLVCGWCGRGMAGWTCRACGGTRVWAPVVGSERTAEELGRAFPQVRVLDSAGTRVLDEVADEPALVVATPGAEPVAVKGYAAAVLLDGWALLERDDLRAAEEALRRWMGAAALVRGAVDGGRVLLVADPTARAAQALVAWDPETFADREYADRVDARLPPGARVATVEGAAAAVADLLTNARLPDPVDILGPVPLPRSHRHPDNSRNDSAPSDGGPSDRGPSDSGPSERGDEVVGPATVGLDVSVRTIVRTPLTHANDLAAALRAAAAVRSAAKAPGSVRVRLDPVPFP